jgi:hypothetical protein
MGLDCNCLECQMMRDHNDDPPDEVIELMGGCNYCAMTGHEDYPRNTKPCRRGHVEPPRPYLPPLPEPVEDRPKVGGPWKWTGRGWKNLGYKG